MKKKVENNSEVVEPVTPEWRTINRDDDADRPMVSFEFDGLREHTSYEVKVRMRNSLGWSESNQPFVFTTSHGRPSLISLRFLPITLLVRAASRCRRRAGFTDVSFFF